MIATDPYQSLQLKGEVMDMEFSVDTDHRKRRRNRTTQSCLNCHTSKRKCDRKRPCQRCIQLGLTGLCVYEIDDPALRDDPSLDETTRLKNRIAELESLVRELRGKPHPRWAENNFRDGDPSEKWHSRATKCTPLKRRHTPDRQERLSGRSAQSLLSPIKTEPATESSHLYRISASPPPAVRYPGFPASPSTSSFEKEHSQAYVASVPYQTPASSPSIPYHNGTNHISSSYSDSYSDGGNYPLSGSDDGRPYSSGDPYPSQTSTAQFCSCRTNPGTNVAYISLGQQLQSCLGTLRQYSHHPQNTPCVLYRRIVELNDLMQYVFVGHSRGDRNSNHVSGIEPTESNGHGQYTNAADREIISPTVSTSSGHTYTSSSGGVSPQEWNTIANGGYNTYFPPQNDHGLYNHVIT